MGGVIRKLFAQPLLLKKNSYQQNVIHRSKPARIRITAFRMFVNTRNSMKRTLAEKIPCQHLLRFRNLKMESILDKKRTKIYEKKKRRNRERKKRRNERESETK
ncbi:hypothetical protein CDAR_617591 [Caerostris darwini]|uniref:Uncharacterized protein n=1 Tax=Caerostris darwini TaxID=1538125 RepID=A0AAV4VS99_9ARAC|nr:hypothetical protein CDAR_617591 [Caerostris darwini]